MAFNTAYAPWGDALRDDDAPAVAQPRARLDAQLLVAMLLCFTFVGYPAAALVSTVMSDSSIPIYGYRALHGLMGLTVIALSLGRGLTKRRLPTVALIAFWFAYGVRVYADQDLIEPALNHGMLEFLMITVSMGLVPAISAVRAPLLARLERREDCDAFCRLVITAVFWLAWPTLALTIVVAMGSGGLEPAAFRLQTDKLNPISLGNLGVVTLIAAFFWVATRRVRSRPLQAAKWLLFLGACAIGAVGILLAASRGPMVGGALALTVALLFWARRRLFFVGLVFFAGMAVTFVIALSAVEEATDFRPMQRFESMLDSAVVEDESVELRRIAMTNAVEQFLDSPVVGDSLIERVTAYYPHNLYVESLMATGVLGTLPLLLATLLALRSCARIVRGGGESLFIVSLFVLYTITALVSGDISGSQFFWATLGFLCGLDLTVREARSWRDPLHDRHPIRARY